MKIRQEVKPALWGAASGAIICAVIGFTWGGWVTGAKAREALEKNTNTSVISVLAPICAEQFRQQADAPAKLEELNKLGSYEQPKFIEAGGWAIMPGAKTAAAGVARGC